MVSVKVCLLLAGSLQVLLYGESPNTDVTHGDTTGTNEIAWSFQYVSISFFFWGGLSTLQIEC